MKILLIISIFLTNCGTEKVDGTTVSNPDQSILENVEPDTLTVIMCQEAIACNVDGECVDTVKEVEFELDTSMYYQACFNFRPCDGKNVYSEQQISDYRELNCG